MVELIDVVLQSTPERQLATICLGPADLVVYTESQLEAHGE